MGTIRVRMFPVKSHYKFIHDKYLTMPHSTRHLPGNKTDITKNFTHYVGLGRYCKEVHPTRGQERIGTVDNFYEHSAGRAVLDFRFFYYHGEYLSFVSRLSETALLTINTC